MAAGDDGRRAPRAGGGSGVGIRSARSRHRRTAAVVRPAAAGPAPPRLAEQARPCCQGNWLPGQSDEHPTRRSGPIARSKAFNTEEDRGPRSATENGLNALCGRLILLCVKVPLRFDGSRHSPDCPALPTAAPGLLGVVPLNAAAPSERGRLFHRPVVRGQRRLHRGPRDLGRWKDQGYGEEDRWLHQAADSGRQGEPVAAGRPRARPARAEHHAVLQGLQRGDAEHGAGHAGAGGDHRLRRPHLLLHHQDAAEHLFPDEGGEGRQGQPDGGQERADRADHHGAAPRDRRSRR